MFNMFTRFFAILLFSLGAIGFLSYGYVKNVTPPVADVIMTHDCGTYGVEEIELILTDVSIKNSHRARDSICV